MSSHIGKIEKMSGPVKAKYLDTLKDELKSSPLAQNVACGLILTVLEKLTETEFECPCKAHWMNALFSSLFFIIPALLSFFLMLAIKGWNQPTISCVVPSVIWLLLMFIDGRYLACAKTDWQGRYVVLDSAPQKWCEPLANTSCVYKNQTGTGQQCMLKSQEFYTTSQWIGLGIMAVISVGFGVYALRRYLNSERKSDQDEIEMASAGPTELCRTEEMKQKNISLDDVYDFMLLMSEKSVKSIYDRRISAV